MATITKIQASVPGISTRKKVAAYARVSRDGERLLHSFSAQVSYYSMLIQKNPEWEYVGVYSDEAITGTRTDWRDGFQKMMEDCDAGKIDIILTKSVSRWARNTVDLLNSIRHLKEIGVEVRFEEQNISTFSGDGELMLTILASFAQEEVTSTSQNIKWAKKKQAEKGIMTNTSVPYGYRCKDRTPVIVPEQAEIVRWIFNEYINGGLLLDIAKKLNDENIPGKRGGKWAATTLQRMLGNETYTGNLLLGKWYTEDPLKHNMVKNRGEQEMYLVEDSHDAIIDRETFEKAQVELARRGELKQYASPRVTMNEFSGKIICAGCGLPFSRQANRMANNYKVPRWSCKKDGGKCLTPGILEPELKQMFCMVTDTETYSESLFREQIDHIEVSLDSMVTYCFKNGEKKSLLFEMRKRSPLTTRRKDTVTLAGRIICSKCGGVFRYRSQQSEKKDGGRLGYWRCEHSGECKMPTLRDDDLKVLIADVLDLPEFDEDAFKARIKQIEVESNSLRFGFFNGQTQIRAWNPPSHKGSKWTEERRRQAKESGSYKRQWTEERRQQASEIAKAQRRMRKNAKS